MLEKRKKPSMNAAPKGRIPVASTEGYKAFVSNEDPNIKDGSTTDDWFQILWWWRDLAWNLIDAEQ
jgi:hypothetical protein